ncbi:sensor histidine kinase [Wenzhouxiangella sp. XN79A]|uniref:sensor histidine kinase n=1 Tax=Wenzhouxiangella sp. XN79A TaxID=2724193 RepID=UPI00144A57DA|nr:histidine kinase [Wenzhouxiangella sp. XN79A]NKI36341.1 sensor histidine kinase [Wenzhouxiangella sp. XN79A]
MKHALRDGLLDLVISPLAWASYAAWLAVWLSASAVFGAQDAVFPSIVDGLLFAWLAAWLVCLLDDLVPTAVDNAALLALIALTALALWFIQNGTTPILLILVAIRLTGRLPSRALVAGLIVANLYFFGVLLGPWDQSVQSAALTVLAMGGFQLFAVMVMVYANRAERLAEDLQAVNARLLATRSLLGETARDHERLRLSRELHDVAGHKVTALKLNLRGLARKLDGDAAEAVEQSTALADELLQDLRSVVRHLRETEGIDLGKSLRELARPFPRPRLELVIADEARIPRADQAEALLRVVQEGLTNAARHGPAEVLRVVLDRNGGRFVLVVEDDGRVRGPLQPGNGLTGMRERLDELGGTLDIGTSDLGGVRLTASLPLEPNA